MLMRWSEGSDIIHSMGFTDAHEVKAAYMGNIDANHMKALFVSCLTSQQHARVS